MLRFIELCLHRRKTILSLLVFLLITGTSAYLNIPKESKPDIRIPIIYVSLHLQGILPQDSERLLVKPIENKLRTIEGIKEMTSTAYENGGFVLLEFNAGMDINKARSDVKDQVDIAKSELPNEADDPVIHEVNLSLFPVLIIKLSGEIPLRRLYHMANDLQDSIEGHVPQVLDVKIVGNREEVVEIIIDPRKIAAHGLSFAQVMQFFINNHIVVTPGHLQVGDGQLSLNVPGLLENVNDIMNLPVVANKNKAVKFQEVASIKRTYKSPQQFARDRGYPSVALQVSKRTGENIIETVDAVKKVTADLQKMWPEQVSVSFAQDESHRIVEMIEELQNNIIFAVILVMLVIVVSLGWRSSLLVGIAVPGSFLIGVLVLKSMGLTVNIVVLFSLILSVGMLVDGAIIVVEYADRQMVSGMSRFDAYLDASKRMAWPVISSISTILVVFLPLLFWPGIVGQFMKYMPITLLATLTASLLMALIFIPALGSYWGKALPHGSVQEEVENSETGDLTKLKSFTGWYVRILHRVLDYPGKVMAGVFVLLFSVFVIYVNLGRGIEFFPNIESDMAIVNIYGRGNLSPEAMDELVKEVEDKILDMTEFSSVYTSSGIPREKNGQDREDLIGKITLELVDWRKRRPAQDVLQTVKERVGSTSGLEIEVIGDRKGPSSKKPIEIEVSTKDSAQLEDAFNKVYSQVLQVKGLANIEDSRSIPGVEWRIAIDRAEAARQGLDVLTIGNAIRLITDQGLKLGTFRPDDSEDEIDITIRYPEDKRKWSLLQDMRVVNIEGASTPISTVVSYHPQKKLNVISRIDGRRALKIKTDVEPGVLVNDKVVELKQLIMPLNDGIMQVSFKGEDKDQNETAQFLKRAFGVAMFLIALILLTQFDSFFSTIVILSAVLLSSIGVFIGLLINNMPFGIVMGGIGMISLAGIIVSNNIIFIDTFDVLKHKIPNVREAIIRTGAQRLRPVILTKLTAILGLLPIMWQLNIDFLTREVSYGAPSTQWWIQLAMTIVYGLLFASPLTLIVTPCALLLREEWPLYKQKIKQSFIRLARPKTS